MLSRQWKNTLYTPLMSQNPVKITRFKPMNVTIAVPDIQEVSVQSVFFQCFMLCFKDVKLETVFV